MRTLEDARLFLALRRRPELCRKVAAQRSAVAAELDALRAILTAGDHPVVAADAGLSSPGPRRPDGDPPPPPSARPAVQ